MPQPIMAPCRAPAYTRKHACQAADVATGCRDRRRVGCWFGCSRSECSMTGTEVQHGSEHADGVIDLLGMLAYASLSSYFRLSADASVAASLPAPAPPTGSRDLSRRTWVTAFRLISTARSPTSPIRRRRLS